MDNNFWDSITPNRWTYICQIAQNGYAVPTTIDFQ